MLIKINRDIVVRVLNLMHVGNFYCQTEVVIFGADMSLSTHFDNGKKKTYRDYI